MVVKFRLLGNLRYLSHAEMMRVFERACVRAAVGLQYSQGFNPHAKLSLPLPKSVAVEGDEELLCLRVCGKWLAEGDADSLSSRFDIDRFKRELSEQMPKGCEVLSVAIRGAKSSFLPLGATYAIPVRAEYLNGKLRETIEGILASESLRVRRERGMKGRGFKDVDVRGFLKSMELDERGVVVECGINVGGSVRVEEVLMLLGLDAEKLAGPVRRTRVLWGEL